MGKWQGRRTLVGSAAFCFGWEALRSPRRLLAVCWSFPPHYSGRQEGESGETRGRRDEDRMSIECGRHDTEGEPE